MRYAILLLALSACGHEVELKNGPGTLETQFGTLWYNVVGEGDGTPAIILHGGPGVPGYYMKPLEALGADRPVVFYDQIGAGRSTSSTDSTAWTIPNFVAELDSLRSALGLDRVFLVGHSWGTILAAEYWHAHPEHVKGIVFMSEAVDIPAWLADADTLLMSMPDSIQRVVAQTEAAGTFDDPAYQAAVMAYYGQFLARRQPWSADLDSSLTQFNTDIYGYMWGPSEFTATGTLKDYDASSWLGQINVPVLFTTGEFDESRPPTVRRIAALIPGAEVAIIPDAGHLTMQDNPEVTNRVVEEFLRKVDQ